MNNEGIKSNDNITKAVGFIGASVFLIILGFLMFVGKDEFMPYVVYAIDGLMVVLGIILMIKYIVGKEYEKTTNFGFALGAIFIILGICGAFRSEAVIKSLTSLAGFIVLILGAIMLQHSIALIAMKFKAWPVPFVFAIVAVVCGLVMLMAVAPNMYAGILMMAVGVLYIVSFIIDLVGTAKFKKQANVPAAAEVSESSSIENNNQPLPEDDIEATEE